MTLARRFVESSLWATGASLGATGVLVIRSIVLARLLPVEVFGVYAFAAAIVGLTAPLARFGMGGALLHRTAETRDEQQAAAVHFTLTLLFTLLWAGALLTGAALFADGESLVALAVLTGTQVGMHLTSTPDALLRRRVTHRPLATLRIVNVLASTAIALVFAWSGSGLWALLVIDVTICLSSLLALYGWQRVWRPSLRWRAETVRHFLSFGSRNLIGRLLETALRRIDKLWIGAAMDQQALGLYSRAAVYARAPLGSIEQPLSSVTTGVYAELHDDRHRLSRAITRVAALLFRGGCLLAVLVGLLAPELVSLLIGEKWLPMVPAFRILLAAFVFDAAGKTFAQLLIAVGEPALRVRVRSAQVVILVVGIVTLGPRLGLGGVATSVLLSSFAGMISFVWFSRDFVDFSLPRLFGPPLPAAATALVLGIAAEKLLPPGLWVWASVASQALACVAGYVLVALILEGRTLVTNLGVVARQLRNAPAAAGGTNGAE